MLYVNWFSPFDICETLSFTKYFFRYDVPYMYLQTAAVRQGYSEELSSYLISSIGLSNVVGNVRRNKFHDLCIIFTDYWAIIFEDGIYQSIILHFSDYLRVYGWQRMGKCNNSLWCVHDNLRWDHLSHALSDGDEFLGIIHYLWSIWSYNSCKLCADLCYSCSSEFRINFEINP